jgi:hypothetical protein
MKKNFYAIAFGLILCLQTGILFSQAPIFDRWDTLYANVDYTNTTKYLYQHDLLKFGNNLAIISDSGATATEGSYLQIFNTTSNALTTINYQRLFCDRGVNAGAVHTTTNGVSYLCWGGRHNSNLNSNWGFYTYNSQTNTVTSESVPLPANVHIGVMNLGFFSPSTNDDSVTVFVNEHLANSDSIYIYRKHYAQTGFVNTNVKLPILLDCITKVFTFNNEMFVAGYVFPYSGKLLRSSDGITFTVETNYDSNFPSDYIVDADVMNNKIYFGTFNGNQGYKIVETPDGVNYTTLVTNTNPRGFQSIQCFDNTVWYSYYLFLGNRPSNSSSINSYALYAPSVGYLNMSTFAETTSVDTLGRSNNDGKTFKLKKVNSRLFLSGDYYYANSTPGNFIYEFIPPVANFSVTGNTLCANTPYSYTSQSTNMDSVRWFIDNNFCFSNANNINTTFGAGSHTIGLIAISGTQKDTMQHVINAYGIGIVLNPAFNACMNNLIPMTVSLTSAVNPVTFTWTPQATLVQTTLNSPTCVVTATAAGTYSYNVAVTDANGCTATSNNNLILVGTNKDLSGAVDVASVPVMGGNVILYKYEPILTKFDSVNYQPLNSSGTFTFSQNDAYTYIMACVPTSNTLLITYAPSEISWKTATVVTHGCVNNTIQNISVIPILNIGTGPGVLSGKITEGQGYNNRSANVTAPGNPIGGLTIKGGRNPGGNIVAQGRTDPAGGYTLSGLPANVAGEHYFILVDIPGLDTNHTYHRAITSVSLAYTNLDFIVDSARINPTQDTKLKEINIDDNVVKIYPNPTNGMITMSFDMKSADPISVKLLDISGKEVKTIIPPGTYFGTNLKMKEDLSLLNAGIYIMNIKIGDADRTTKIVITH